MKKIFYGEKKERNKLIEIDKERKRKKRRLLSE